MKIRNVNEWNGNQSSSYCRSIKIKEKGEGEVQALS